jgi:hypothetical protein
MKTRIKILVTVLLLGSIIAFASCSKDANCPGGTYDTFAECDKETNDVDCICVEEDGKWKAVPNP